eukprot:747464-Hanusia_phi.AAC.1
MENILDTYMQIGAELMDDSSKERGPSKLDGTADDISTPFSFSSFLSAHLDSALPLLSFSTHPPPKLRVSPLDGGVWYRNYGKKSDLLTSRSSKQREGATNGGQEVWTDAPRVLLEEMAMELAGGLWADQEVSVSSCRTAVRTSLSEYLRGLPRLYRRKEHEIRKQRAANCFSRLTRGPARQQHLSCLLALCDLEWKEERRQCERLSFNNLPCLHAAASCSQEEACRSGVTFASYSGCGRGRREREDPFTFLAANHLFYEACEALPDACSEFLCVPLRCRRSEERRVEGAEEGPEDSERKTKTAEMKKVSEKDGRPLVSCRVYVLGTREAYKEEEGFLAEGSSTPCFLQKIVQQVEERRFAEGLASSASQEEGRAADGHGSNKSTDKKSGPGGAGAGGGGGMEETDWPSLPLLANIRSTRWSDRSKRIATSGREEGTSSEKQGNSRRKRTTNALEDALSSALEKK